MIPIEEALNDFFEDYDALTQDVSSAGFGEFENTLKRWAYFLNDNEISGPIVKKLTSQVDFGSWFKDQNSSGSSMVGSKRFDWPLESESRIGMQLKLIGALVDGSVQLTNLLVNYFYKANNLDSMISELNAQLFVPMTRDLRRLIARMIKSSPPVVPASDRVVPIDHNSAEYRNAEGTLAKLEEALEQTNDYPDTEDKSQRVAEVSAARRLLRAARVRVEAIVAVILPPLKWLANHFAGGAIGFFASDAIAAIGKLLGPIIGGF